MNGLHLPWLEAMVLVPLAGALWVRREREAERARKWCLLFTSMTLLAALAAAVDFELLGSGPSTSAWRPVQQLLGRELLVVDQLTAPLLPMVALLHFLTTLATLRTKVRRFSFASTLVSEALMLATLACHEPWGVVGLLIVALVPPWLELRARGESTRVYTLHMGLFAVLLVVGWFFVDLEGGEGRVHTWWAIVPLLGAALLRTGMFPFHCWTTDLFERATFGTALLFVTPIVGAYAVVRLVLPIAPDWVLRGMGWLSLCTAIYAAGMALVQHDARRFFCFLFLSHSALVLVGLEAVTPIGLTGALCVWLSVGLSLGGFGLTLRALESRFGRLSLRDYQGHYEHSPSLAICFALTGLASVGFPGTLGYVGAELLVDGAVEAYPIVGVAVVLAAALNGIAVVQAYFRLFTGKRYVSTVPLQMRAREWYAVLALAALLLLGGLAPHYQISSRHDAAELLLKSRAPIASPEVDEDDMKDNDQDDDKVEIDSNEEGR